MNRIFPSSSRFEASIWISIIPVAMAVVFFLFFPFCSTLEVSEVKNGRSLFCVRMGEGEEFILSFVHSVNKRPVYDTIRVERDHLVIVKSRFDSLGAGMPETSVNGMKLGFRKDGWLEWTIGRPVPEVTFFVGWVANHSLYLKGRKVVLTDLAAPGTLLSLRVRKASLYELWKSEPGGES